MMKKIYFLLLILFLLLGLNVNAQIINFPDANFKAKLLEANGSNGIALSYWGGSMEIDSNHDGEISVQETRGVYGLKIQNCGISSLEGISYFTMLLSLKCSSNPINTLDVSNLSLLRVLWCDNCNISTLDLSNLTHVQELMCSGNNQLNSLFIKNGHNDVTIQNMFFSFSNNPNLEYICADENEIIALESKINSYGYTNCHVNSYCSFAPGGTFYETSGNSKYDFNANGCDSNDINITNLKFNISNISRNILGTTFSNESGDYSIKLQSGSYIITPQFENLTYFNISPTSITVDFPTQSSPFNQNFCIIPNGVKSDVEIMLGSLGIARPGFDAKYVLMYRNKGNQIESGSVSLTFDDAVLDYISSNPVFNSQATNSFTWNYTNLQPFESREIEIVFNVNSPMETPAVNIDDVLNYTATISTSNTDETANDNTFTLNQTVVGSYDPNDKTCLEGKTVSPDMIGEYVHYLIRFENTGTFPAENVVVKDMIDLTKFDIATLIPLKGSHDFYTRIKDNKVEFIFENINLDFNDATNDGYVAFKIKTKSDLTVGSIFSNNANIYFDYNFPITTNTYTTTIQALSTQDFDFGNQFTLYPNPVKDILNFNSKENLEIQSVEIYNMLGQVVLVVPNVTSSIDVSTLTKGNYFVKVNTEKGSANTKFIKE